MRRICHLLFRACSRVSPRWEGMFSSGTMICSSAHLEQARTLLSRIEYATTAKFISPYRASGLIMSSASNAKSIASYVKADFLHHTSISVQLTLHYDFFG